MLHYFQFKNFFSFREGATISFQLDGKVPAGIGRGETKVSTVVALKGANASGKTHALKALQFIANFCAKSFESDPKDYIGFNSFFENAEPSEFEVEFVKDGVLYTYFLECTDRSVISEVISRRINSRKTKVIERRNNEIVKAVGEFARIKDIKLRGNASLVATAHQYEIEEIKPIREFFTRILSNVGYDGFRERALGVSSAAKFLHTRKELLNQIVKFLKECDTGISRVEISNGKNEKGADEYFPIFWHTWNGVEKVVTHYEESSGTKFLLRILPQIFVTIENGTILILDEMDMHLHPMVLRKVVNLFLDESINRNNAQLLCSTHDSDVLDQLGKYRVHLVNKQENESFLYRLDELPGDLVRNDRSIVPVYKDGKIGGVPRI